MSPLLLSIVAELHEGSASCARGSSCTVPGDSGEVAAISADRFRRLTAGKARRVVCCMAVCDGFSCVDPVLPLLCGCGMAIYFG